MSVDEMKLKGNVALVAVTVMWCHNCIELNAKYPKLFGLLGTEDPTIQKHTYV